jgi:hypothetical protein
VQNDPRYAAVVGRARVWVVGRGKPLECAASFAVMLGEIVLAGARPGASKIMSVIVLTVGIGVFMLFKPSKKAASGDTFEWNADMAVGCGLVMLALIMDGVYGPYQNKITKEAEKATGEKLSPYHLMFNMNFYQGVFSLVMVSLRPLTSGSI